MRYKLLNKKRKEVELLSKIIATLMSMICHGKRSSEK